jgi:hypothetical protein
LTPVLDPGSSYDLAFRGYREELEIFIGHGRLGPDEDEASLAHVGFLDKQFTREPDAVFFDLKIRAKSETGLAVVLFCPF